MAINKTYEELVESAYEDDRKRNRNGMKCFHQGQVDAFSDVLEMLDELEEMEGEE